MDRKIDVIGDVHGHHRALEALGRHLGYAVERDWEHPAGRVPVFLGDLVDRGREGLAVALLVKRLVERDRAVCLMGNHEYNLVEWRHGGRVRKSNRATIDEFPANREGWHRVLEFFETLPIALELPELRIIHAVWHRECIDKVHPVLGAAEEPSLENLTTTQWLRAHIRLESPYGREGLLDHLPDDPVPHSNDRPHEVLIKGHEDRADEDFIDADGRKRTKIRATWWNDLDPRVDTEKPVVFGHYWNVPPVAGVHEALAPPHPSGHPDLDEWQKANVPLVSERGIFDAPRDSRFVCVDYNGVYVATSKASTPTRACIGAYRWPEHQVAWACADAN